MVSFSQLPTVKKDTIFGAARKNFGPCYFVTGLATQHQAVFSGNVSIIKTDISTRILCNGLIRNKIDLDQSMPRKNGK